MLILNRSKLVTVDVLYYLPNYSIIQEFIWQTEDTIPNIPRVHKFLNYWKDNVDAIIRDVLVTAGIGKDIRNINLQVNYADIFKSLN